MTLNANSVFLLIIHAVSSLILMVSSEVAFGSGIDRLFPRRPYWEKQKIQERLHQGEILLSASNQTGGVQISGAFEIKSSQRVILDHFRRLDEFGRGRSFFKKFAKGRGPGEWEIVLAFMGVQRQLRVRVTPEQKTKESSEVEFLVLSGYMAGLRGLVRLKNVSQGTQLGGVAFQSRKKPVSWFFLRAFEALTKQIASRFRKWVEGGPLLKKTEKPI